MNELISLNHRNWKPDEYPGWLVFEIENDIAIRPVQDQVARELITPSSGKNSVLQLNMGEGKSSVIVPIVAWALADGKKLVRIVVLKPNKDLAYMNELFEAGKLKPVIDGPYNLDEVAEAFRMFGKVRHKGKVVITL